MSLYATYIFLAFFKSITSQAATMMTASNAFLHAFLVAGLIAVAAAVAVCCCALAGVVGHGDDDGNNDAMIKNK
jgi:hypothetical protein